MILIRVMRWSRKIGSRWKASMFMKFICTQIQWFGICMRMSVGVSVFLYLFAFRTTRMLYIHLHENGFSFGWHTEFPNNLHSNHNQIRFSTFVHFSITRKTKFFFFNGTDFFGNWIEIITIIRRLKEKTKHRDSDGDSDSRRKKRIGLNEIRTPAYNVLACSSITKHPSRFMGFSSISKRRV